ncbi:MAG: hypothetical protein QM690_13275 [Sphingobium sp.]
MVRHVTINGKRVRVAGCSPRLAAAIDAAVADKPGKKRARTGLPRPAPRGIDDIALPVGQRIICWWPPVGLGANDRLHWARLNRLKQIYFRECMTEAIAARITLPAARPVRIQIDFFPPDRAARDDDNPVYAFKSGRDGIAHALNIDDKHFSVTPVFHPDEPRSCVVVTILEPETTA